MPAAVVVALVPVSALLPVRAVRAVAEAALLVARLRLRVQLIRAAVVAGLVSPALPRAPAAPVS